MRRLAIGSALVASVMAAFVGAAMGGGNGQAIGQDPVRLALTQCSNAGIGNGGEFGGVAGSVFLGGALIGGDCLNAALTTEQVESVIEQGSCQVVFGKFPIGYVLACEFDPGNSAAHNHADGDL